MTSFGEELEEIVQSAARDLEARAVAGSRTLYHYTDSQGFLKILEGQCVRATEVRYLNDGSEFVYLLNLVSRAASESEREWKGASAREFLRRLHSPGWVGPPSMTYQVYVACFSEEWDVLSQWRAYANDGLGYSLGFSADSTFSTDPGSVDSARASRLFKVVYETVEQSVLVKRYVDRVLGTLTRHEEASGSARERDAAIDSAATSLYKAVIPFAVLMKNPGFREESEWRMVFAQHGSSPRRAMLKYRPNRFGIAPFVEFKCGDRLPLRFVGLGPKLNSFEAQQAARGFVESRGYASAQVDFEHSKTTYR